jgi:hypothetical protein
MNVPRREAASVIVDGVLYSVGGVFGKPSKMHQIVSS